MERKFRIFVRVVVNFICLPLFPTVFAVHDMFAWHTWNYKMAARFELSCWWHNICGKL